MTGESDKRDKNEARKIAIALGCLFLVLAVAAVLMLPALAEIAAVHFAPGLGIKDSAIIAFFVTVVLLIIFAVFAGDGLVGELTVMLAAFFLFFLIFWLFIAWLF